MNLHTEEQRNVFLKLYNALPSHYVKKIVLCLQSGIMIKYCMHFALEELIT